MNQNQKIIFISGQSYELMKTIKSENNDTIYQGKNQQTQQQVAIKIKFKISDSRLCLLNSLKDSPKQQIINIHSIDKKYNGNPDYCAIVMEFGHQNLLQFMPKFLSFNKQQKMILFFQVANRVNELHKLNYSHRQLTTKSFFVFSNNNFSLPQIKLFDLGQCNDFITTQQYQTVDYLAPEQLVENTQYPYSIDSWSLGCILFEILIGQPFIQGIIYYLNQNNVSINKQQIIDWIGNITQQQIDEYISQQDPQKMAEKEKSLIKKLLFKTPFHRLKVKDLMEYLVNPSLILNFTQPVLNISTNPSPIIIQRTYDIYNFNRHIEQINQTKQLFIKMSLNQNPILEIYNQIVFFRKQNPNCLQEQILYFKDCEKYFKLNEELYNQHSQELKNNKIQFKKKEIGKNLDEFYSQSKEEKQKLDGLSQLILTASDTIKFEGNQEDYIYAYEKWQKCRKIQSFVIEFENLVNLKDLQRIQQVKQSSEQLLKYNLELESIQSEIMVNLCKNIRLNSNSLRLEIVLIIMIQIFQIQGLLQRRNRNSNNDVQEQFDLLNQQFLNYKDSLEKNQIFKYDIDKLIQEFTKINTFKSNLINEIKEANRQKLETKINDQKVLLEIIELTIYLKFTQVILFHKLKT